MIIYGIYTPSIKQELAEYSESHQDSWFTLNSEETKTCDECDREITDESYFLDRDSIVFDDDDKGGKYPVVCYDCYTDQYRDRCYSCHGLFDPDEFPPEKIGEYMIVIPNEVPLFESDEKGDQVYCKKGYYRVIDWPLWSDSCLGDHFSFYTNAIEFIAPLDALDEKFDDDDISGRICIYCMSNLEADK